jgi:hypothetical protein
MNQKKEIELRVLSVARKLGAPIPTGEIPGEEPDFTIPTGIGVLGLEVSELVRPASNESGIPPVEAANHYQEFMKMAEEEYYSHLDAKPARVRFYFSDSHVVKRNKREMARVFADFVRTNRHRADPVVNLARLEMPDGFQFDSVSITSEAGAWWCGQAGVVTLSDIQESLEARISAKNKLVPRYRKNLLSNSPLWLLLYSTGTIAGHVPIPSPINEWRFQFDFERVFWLGCLENEVVEIQKLDSVADSIQLVPNSRGG